MAGIHITDIEAAINWWRERRPSPDGITACGEVRALAEVYALMVYYREALCDEATMPARAKAAWSAWYDTTPDAPCIAICSTSQGDAVCKGCGRTFEEVRHWTEMSPGDKRAVWRRITMDGTAWRFNRYAERARAGAHAVTTPAAAEAATAATVQAAVPAPGDAAPGPGPSQTRQATTPVAHAAAAPQADSAVPATAPGNAVAAPPTDRTAATPTPEPTGAASASDRSAAALAPGDMGGEAFPPSPAVPAATAAPPPGGGATPPALPAARRGDRAALARRRH